MRRALQLFVIAIAVTGFALGGGLLLTLGDGDGTDPVGDAGAPAPAVAAVTLADLDLEHLAVQRAAFCDLLPPTAVDAALGGTPDDTTAYANGQRGQITRKVTDVAHEFDCQFALGSGDQQSTARAWVFAPPVTPADARSLRRFQAKLGFCDVLSDVPAYGDRSVATYCQTTHGPQVSYRGLFGDAWLACSLTSTPGTAQADLRARGDAWCAAVGVAASTPATSTASPAPTTTG